MEKNNPSQPRYATFFSLVMLLVVVFSSNFVSSAEFDNTKEYDPITREATFYNTFLGLKTSQIGKATLVSPLNVNVGVGYQQVAKFELEAYSDYNDALKQFTFTDMKKKEKINRDIDIKILSYEEVEVEDYENVNCVETLTPNGEYYPVCDREIIGTHTEEREVWAKVTPADLKKNEKVTIGLFTEVQEGDFVDWVPLIYGVEVKEWATWTESLNTDLLAYYTMDESSGTMIDSLGGHNSTSIAGVTQGATGHIGTSYSFDGSNDRVNVTSNPLKNNVGNYAISFWSYTGTASGTFLDETREINNSNIIKIYDDGNGMVYYHFDNTGTLSLLYNQPSAYTDNTWTHYVFQNNGTHGMIYNDGVLDSILAVGIVGEKIGDSLILGETFSEVQDWNGKLDELAIWGRSLSQAEITQLYNNSYGITFTDDFGPGDQDPNITLDSPTNTTYTTLQEDIQINFTAFDDINLTNVALWVDEPTGSTTYNNASGINNSVYTFDLDLDEHGTYEVYGIATDNNSQTTQTDSIFFVVNTTPPIFENSPGQDLNISTLSVYHALGTNLSYAYPDNVTIYIYNSTGLLDTHTEDDQHASTTWTGLTDGTYYLNGTIYTTTGQAVTSETYEVLVNTTPSVEFTGKGAINNSKYTDTNVTLTINFADPYADILQIHYLLPGESIYSRNYCDETSTPVNCSFTAGQGLNKYYASLLTDPYHLVYTNTYHLYVDSIDPVVSLTDTTDVTTYAVPYLTPVTITATDTNLDTCTYWTSDNATNITKPCNTEFNISWANGGNKTIYTLVNDTFGNTATAQDTFYINYIQESFDYRASAVEFEDQTIYLNLTLPSLLSTYSVNFTYGGTSYTPTISDDGTTIQASVDIVTPTTSPQNITWYYSVNGYSNITSASQTISELTPLVIQSGACTDLAVTYVIQDEVNATNLTGVVSYNIKYGPSSSTNEGKEIYGSVSGSSVNICINATQTPVYYIGYGEFQYSAPGYVDRRYYMFEDSTISNDTYDIKYLRELETTEQTSFLLTLQDSDLNVYANKYTALWRWYPDLNSYQIVEMGKTDGDGQTIAHVRTEDVDYRTALYELNGSLIKFDDPRRFLCTSAPCSLDIVVGEDGGDLTAFFDVEQSLTYNETTGIISYVYNDPNQVTETMRLLVEKINPNNEITICDTETTGYTGVINCNVSIYSGTFKATAFRTASPEVPIAQKVISTANTLFRSSFGLFFSIIIWLAIVLTGLAGGPILAVVLGIVGLIPALFLGSINLAIFTGIAVLGAIILHFIKRGSA